jgi:uncharacterized FlaG/YvyC family protein
MASDGQPGKIPVISRVQGSQAPRTVSAQPSGRSLPQSGKPAAAARPASPAKPDLRAQIALLNKNLNDSGKPIQFRVAPSSNDKLIQEINPANGAVVAEFAASEFAELARSLGISGVLVDSLA